MRITLTKFEFHARDARTLRLLGNPYELHRFVFSTAGNGRDPGRILYRLEDTMGLSTRKPTVLVQTESAIVPVLDPTYREYIAIHSKSLEVRLISGRAYRFRSRVNPVRSLPPEKPGGRGKRIGVYEADEQQRWFEGQMMKHGFSVRSALHQREPWLEIRKPGSQGKRRLIFASAFFEGVVDVRDPAKAEEALVSGIGPGKGFGFGLLSFART